MHLVHFRSSIIKPLLSSPGLTKLRKFHYQFLKDLILAGIIIVGYKQSFDHQFTIVGRYCAKILDFTIITMVIDYFLNFLVEITKMLALIVKCHFILTAEVTTIIKVNFIINSPTIREVKLEVYFTKLIIAIITKLEFH